MSFAGESAVNVAPARATAAAVPACVLAEVGLPRGPVELTFDQERKHQLDQQKAAQRKKDLEKAARQAQVGAQTAPLCLMRPARRKRSKQSERRRRNGSARHTRRSSSSRRSRRGLIVGGY